MSESLIEKHETIVIEMAGIYLDNMELELGRKYQNNEHQINPSLSEAQYLGLLKKHDVPDNEFAELYLEFQKMKPTAHLKQALDAFTASGGGVDIEPSFDEDSQRLKVSINFIIKDQAFEKIEGLSPIEDIILRMNAMLQIDTVLSGSDPDVSPSF